ncbi:hypothetical protein VM98_33385, partial [Streptomyces rubellomurinus subsp. indigoferus]
MVTDTRHCTRSPGTTGLVNNTFDTARFARGEGEEVGEATAVCAVADGSGPPVTTAVFVGVTVAFGSSVPLNVQLTDEPTAISTAGHVATPPLTGHTDPSEATIEAPLTPTGTWSVTTTFRA